MLGGVLRRSQETRAIQSTPWGDWPGDSTPTWSGERVTVDSALQLSTVYGCVRLIADGISTLPLDVFRRLGDGSSQEVPTPAWLEYPTVDLTMTEWLGQILVAMLTEGNAPFVVTRSDSGAIVELVPLAPSRVFVRRDNGRRVVFVDGRPFTGELVIIRGLMLPGAEMGLSPIEYARQTIGLGQAGIRYGAQFFAGDGNMPGVIESPGMLQGNQKTELAEQWRRKRTKGGRGLPGVLEGGMTWKPTGVTNEQAQFLATRQYTASQIAGEIFLVDPSDLGIPVQGTSLTYANLEQRNARRLQVTFLPWIVRLEHALSALLARPRYVKLNVSGLLRGDLKTRYESYAIGISNGFLEENEARRWEELPPLDEETMTDDDAVA